ncbi:MAG: hypothetical protein H6Q31_1645 [Bacteroidetes bacterium]|jgi:hypothetical protein|nr:hypothetical protein [Bacteroidota bacterium]
MNTLESAIPSLSAIRKSLTICSLLFLCATSLCAVADQELSPVAKVLDYEITLLEGDIIPLAEAMPADKYDFAPTAGEFKGVRTFADQISHVAVNIYSVSSAILEEKLPPEIGTGEYGPAKLKTKDDLVAYLKGSLAYAHKAMARLTAANLTDEVQAWWGKASRLFMADVAMWHSYDHYGQLVEYLRMNGIVPPASRPRK